MNLKIAGGCGEHGRNCFLVESCCTFIVDCGIMAGSDDPYPRLIHDEIQKAEYVFLTHSHADHTGALPWLYQNGFRGRVIASESTLKQLPFTVSDSIAIEEICSGKSARLNGFAFEYGRSGHCKGSVWYHFHTDDGSVLFSGDYTEHSIVYNCDKIRGRKADITVIDCAYGYDERSFSQCCEEILSEVKKLKKIYGTLFFPVPKYGRGIELLKLFRENLPDMKCGGDSHFINQVQSISPHDYWYSCEKITEIPCSSAEKSDIFFISDPQLRSADSRSISEEIIRNSGFGIMTGTVESGTYSEKLIESGIMKQLRYPVHQNYSEFRLLAEMNDFKRIIPYHSEEITSAAL